jgi:putative phage-type endonuclease
MKFYNVEQNTEEWMAMRLGKFTASMFADLMQTPSTLGYQKAINRVVYERATGEQPESFSNEYMDRGHELEPMAKEAYELLTFNTVSNGGFFEVNEWIGASPDGVVNNEGIVEIKAPAFNTMIDYIVKNELPKTYFWQVQGQLWVTGLQWCDFMAYHPKLKPVVVRVYPDSEAFKTLDTTLAKAVELVLQRLKLVL